MVIHDPDLSRAVGSPVEDHAPLVVDADRMESGEVVVDEIEGGEQKQRFVRAARAASPN